MFTRASLCSRSARCVGLWRLEAARGASLRDQTDVEGCAKCHSAEQLQQAPCHRGSPRGPTAAAATTRRSNLLWFDPVSCANDLRPRRCTRQVSGNLFSRGRQRHRAQQPQNTATPTTAAATKTTATANTPHAEKTKQKSHKSGSAAPAQIRRPSNSTARAGPNHMLGARGLFHRKGTCWNAG